MEPRKPDPTRRSTFADRWRNRIADLVLSTHPRLRTRIMLPLLGTLIYLTAIVIQSLAAYMGRIDPSHAQIMNLIDGVAALCTYPMVRSGWTLRFKDPSLILVQLLVGITVTIIGYALLPGMRSSLLQLLCLIQLFGFLSLTPRQTMGIGFYCVAGLLIMLFTMGVMSPADFDLRQEAPVIVMAAGVLLLLAFAARKYSLLRQLTAQQKHQLQVKKAELYELATHDALTGLINRSHMQILLEQEVARQRRTGRPFCLALLDIDHFKRVNDAYGHQAGDEVLQGFAQSARTLLRETDVLARWGGEEFLVLLTDANPDQALGGVQRLRQQMASKALAQGVPELRVTFSAGLALHVLKRSTSNTINRADMALYEAKSQGRDCSVVASSADTVY
jgi:diguanylate cyclase (GGDEF)-like protein